MKLKLLKKTTEAKGTVSFYWESEKEISWLPGQYLYYTLPVLIYPDPRGATRHFTISSSPTEVTPVLTTRIRKESGYKLTLNDLKIGDTIDAEGPSGTFILDEQEAGDHVFIAGGIGVTPFRSMIKYAIDKDLNSNFSLVYSNSTPEEIAFRKDLEKWEKDSSKLNLFLTVSHPEEGKEKWTGRTGRTDDKLIALAAKGLNNPTYWLCGPPGMVDAMEAVLSKMKIPDDKIRVEKFTGY